jgi:hypothetical protein
MRAGNELDRLTAARPRVTQRTGDVVGAAQEQHLLRQILTVPPAPRRPRARTFGLAHPSRAGLLASGLAVTAVSVSAAIVLASGTPAVPGSPPAAHPSASESPAGGQFAHQVLLAAASVAAVSQNTRGHYWYVDETAAGPGYRQVQKTWTSRYGTRQWVWAGRKTNNRVMEFSGTPGFSLSGDESLPQMENLPPIWATKRQARHWVQMREQLGHYLQAHPGALQPGVLSFGQLQKLPAVPAALTAKIVAIERTVDHWMPHRGPLGVQVFLCLTNLVAGAPVPPQVHAAAFRAIAALPGVTSLGPTGGGLGLRFRLGGSMSATLVVDSTTSQVRETLTVIGVGGEVSSDSVAAQWTSRLPK